MKYVALLRGINVWWNKKVEMTRLKYCFGEMWFSNVSTYINSGNVIFESENDDFTHIENQLMEEFGFEIPIVYRERENIGNLVDQIPKEWHNDDSQKTDVLFLSNEFDTEESLDLIKIKPWIDNVIYLPWAIVWNISREHYSKSGMNNFVKSKLYKNMTARNINTVRKLATLLGS